MAAPPENSKSGTDALSLAGLALILIPVALGAGITFLVEAFKNHNTKSKEDRDDAKKIAAESREEQRQIGKQRRDYERTAAEEIDKEFSALIRILPELFRSNARADNADELREKSNHSFDEINAKAAGLPTAIRSEILRLAQLLRFADEIGRGRHSPGYHYHSQSQVVENVGEYTHLYIASIVRNDDPPEYRHVIREYLHAYDIVMEDRKSEYALEIHEAETDRAKWLEKHHFAKGKYAKPSRPAGAQ